MYGTTNPNRYLPTRFPVITSNVFEYNNYRPPTKLREGNVLTGVCLFMGRVVPMWPLLMNHWTSLYRAPPTPAPLPTSDMGPPSHGPTPNGGHQCRPVQNCFCLYWHLVAGAHTVDKWTILILLECFLVIHYYPSLINFINYYISIKIKTYH